MKARQFPRFAVEATVSIQDADGTILRGRTKNLSKGGLCAQIDGPLDSGASCQTSLSLVFSDDAVSEPLVVGTRVCWCTQIGDQFQVGLVFAQLSAETLTYLDMFLRFLEEAEEHELDEADVFVQRSR